VTEWAPPAGCPRARDGGVGPRRCGIIECRKHLLQPGLTAQAPAPHRRRLALVVEDTCQCDVTDRAPDGLPYSVIAGLLSCSRQNVSKVAHRAMRKMRTRLEVFSSES